MRLLIVEDEPQLQTQLAKNLREQSYTVEVASDGEEGLYYGTEYSFDLAVIDLGLPKIDGVSLIKKLRGSQKNYPILILTARDSWQDKVAGLEAGADDYLVKPFHPEELKARVNALLRRASGQATPIFSFGPLHLNTAAKQASVNGETIELTSYEYNTLEYLAHHAGKTISKSELTEHLYEQDFERDSNVIEVFVGRLRKKLDPHGDLKIISTVRGLGYRFNLQKDSA